MAPAEWINLGDDVTYSGTVAGAFEGMLLGVNAIAVSDISYSPAHYETAAALAVRLAREVLEHGLPPGTMLNMNVPDIPVEELKGAAITRMGRRRYEDEIVRREDPRGRSYYWIGGSMPSHHIEEGTDFEAIGNQMASITPLHRDLTNHDAINTIRKWGFTG